MTPIIPTLVIVLASAALATAQDQTKPAKPGGRSGGGQHSPEEIFKHLDTSGDGKISLDEWKAGPRGQKNPTQAEEIFKKVDTDGDGFVSPEEFKAHPPKRGKPAGGAGGGRKTKGKTRNGSAPAQ